MKHSGNEVWIPAIDSQEVIHGNEISCLKLIIWEVLSKAKLLKKIKSSPGPLKCRSSLFISKSVINAPFHFHIKLSAGKVLNNKSLCCTVGSKVQAQGGYSRHTRCGSLMKCYFISLMRILKQDDQYDCITFLAVCG